MRNPKFEDKVEIMGAIQRMHGCSKGHGTLRVNGQRNAVERAPLAFEYPANGSVSFDRQSLPGRGELQVLANEHEEIIELSLGIVGEERRDRSRHKVIPLLP